MTTLGRVVRPTGRTVDPKKVSGSRFVGLTHVGEGTGELLGTMPIEDVRSRVRLFRRGDVLYAGLRPYLNKVYVAEFDGAASSEFIILRASEAIEPRYLGAVVSHPKFVDYATQRSAGGRPRVSFDALDGYTVLLPPVEEQRRIVEKLVEALEAVGRTQQDLARVGRLIGSYRQRLMAFSCSGRLGGLRKLGKGEGAQVSAAGTICGSIGVPRHWGIRRLSDVADIRAGVALGRKYLGNEGLTEARYLSVSNVQRGYLRLDQVKTVRASQSEVERFALRVGDILMIEGGDRDELGRGWVWEGQLGQCIHQNHVFRVRLHDTRFPSRFISYYANELGREYFLTHGRYTTNLASISKASLSALPVPWPPLAEAERIVSYIDKHFASLSELKLECEEAGRLLRRLWDSIFHRGLDGRLVPQCPHDEPAQASLERLRHTNETLTNVDTTGSHTADGAGSAGGRPMTRRKTRADVNKQHLSEVLRFLGGVAPADELWEQSKMSIDEFYKLLRDEIAAGHISERKDTLELPHRHAT